MRVSRSITARLAAAFAMLWLLSGCFSEPEPPRAPQTKSSAPKPSGRHIEALPVPAVIDIDPSTLDADKKQDYDEGYKQGLKMAENRGSETPEAMMQQRDIAIQAALQVAGRAGAKSSAVLKACGKKAGLKAGLAKAPRGE
jgi:hypothetical protein